MRQSIAGMMDPRLTLAVTGLVVLAGCSAVPLGGQATDSTQTLTPVPVERTESTPTQSPTPVADPPPGVFTNGTVYVDRLVFAHINYVRDRSYRWTFSTNRTNDDPNASNQQFVRRAAVDGDTYLFREASPDTNTSQSLFFEDGMGYARITTDDTTEFRPVGDSVEGSQYLLVDTAIERFLTGLSFEVDVVQRDGQTFYRLYAPDGPVPPAVRSDRSRVWNYTATAYVTPEGFVRTLAVDYDREFGSVSEDVSVRLRYTDVESTALTRPDWVGRITPRPTTAPPTNATTTAPPSRTATPPTDATTDPSD
jgi:hypothetical protein